MLQALHNKEVTTVVLSRIKLSGARRQAIYWYSGRCPHIGDGNLVPGSLCDILPAQSPGSYVPRTQTVRTSRTAYKHDSRPQRLTEEFLT